MLFGLLATISGSAQNSLATARQVSLGERIACQTAIEEVYWRHRTAAGGAASRISFAEAVPPEVIQRKAEDAILQSLALERYWGVKITGAQLQAELDRMAAYSRSPEVLAELFAAVGNSAQAAAECLARPLLVDRLIQSYYASDERLHGSLKTRARADLAGATPAAMKGMSGRYTEMEWRRGGTTATATPGVIALESRTFDERVRGLQNSLGDRSGNLPTGRVSELREDQSNFYAVALIAQDHDRVRLATVEWRKIPFESWWSETRPQLPMSLDATSYAFTLPQVAPNSNCRDDSWKPTLQLLDPRYEHTAVWTGSEMIIFGGMSSVGTEYNDGSRYNPATDTWTLIASKGAPSVRTQHVAVWTGREMIVFGGTGDKTGGRYEPVTDTWKPTSTTNAPSGPFSATVVWTGKEMIVWGGIVASTVNTGARYNPSTNTWTATTNSPLAPRAYHTAVWTGTEMVIWNGYDGFIGKMYGDGARYNPTTNTWKSVALANAPNPRYFHTAVWTGTEMIVWGGINYPVYDLSGGRYNPVTDTWTPTSLVGPPSLRWLHAAVWTGKEMIIWGGSGSYDSTGGRYNPTTDTWRSTGLTNAPIGRDTLTGVWTGKEMIVWGGFGFSIPEGFHNDGGRYNPTTDSWLPTGSMNVPSARGLHTATWTGSEMIAWGGSGNGLKDTGGRYDPATDSWRTTSVTGAPTARENPEVVWTGTEAIFWGGDPDGNPFTPGSGGRYNPVTDTWKATSKVNAPFNTYGHSLVWTGTEMIVYGGVSSSLGAWRYKPATNTWTKASLVNDPGHRDHHGALWTGTEMIIWGGSIDAGRNSTGGRYNPATDTWTPTSIPAGLDARMWPVSVWTGTEAIFWGGYDQLFVVYYNDGGRYNPITDAWTKTSLVKAPSPRVAHGVWTGQELVVWGGANDPSGGRYSPATDSWKSTTLTNAPIVRFGGRWSTVWTGSQMIIWGGIIETQQGSLYCASGTPNSAPVASDDSYTARANKQLVVGVKSGVLLNDTDANADLLSAKGLSRPAHGSVQLNTNGSFLYKPTAGYVGPDSFTYQANDGVANSNTATVTITVQ
jgi:N-acetylneuraminic acid mutarotase